MTHHPTRDRYERIKHQLEHCKTKGIIRDWTAQGNPRRWVLIGIGFSDRSYSTSEVEIFLLGASEGRTSAYIVPDPDLREVADSMDRQYARTQAEMRANSAAKVRPKLPLVESGKPELGTEISVMFGSGDPGDECACPACKSTEPDCAEDCDARQSLPRA